MGSLQLLAESYSPAWLNEHGFSLYKDFRPEADRWGERAEMKCAKVLALRRKKDPGDNIVSKKAVLEGKTDDSKTGAKVQANVQDSKESEDDPEPFAKRVKNMSVEGYEAAPVESDSHGAFWDEDL